jgi:hypothetical protein
MRPFYRHESAIDSAHIAGVIGASFAAAIGFRLNRGKNGFERLGIFLCAQRREISGAEEESRMFLCECAGAKECDYEKCPDWLVSL